MLNDSQNDSQNGSLVALIQDYRSLINRADNGVTQHCFKANNNHDKLQALRSKVQLHDMSFIYCVVVEFRLNQIF